MRGPAAKPRDAPKPVDDRNSLDDILATISQREKLLDAAVEYLAVPTLTMTYEEMTSNHRAAIRRLSAFLQVFSFFFFFLSSSSYTFLSRLILV